MFTKTHMLRLWNHSLYTEATTQCLLKFYHRPPDNADVPANVKRPHNNDNNVIIFKLCIDLLDEALIPLSRFYTYYFQIYIIISQLFLTSSRDSRCVRYLFLVFAASISPYGNKSSKHKTFMKIKNRRYPRWRLSPLKAINSIKSGRSKIHKTPTNQVRCSCQSCLATRCR